VSEHDHQLTSIACRHLSIIPNALTLCIIRLYDARDLWSVNLACAIGTGRLLVCLLHSNGGRMVKGSDLSAMEEAGTCACSVAVRIAELGKFWFHGLRIPVILHDELICFSFCSFD
jgi:hypothetical protein